MNAQACCHRLQIYIYKAGKRPTNMNILLGTTAKNNVNSTHKFSILARVDEVWRPRAQVPAIYTAILITAPILDPKVTFSLHVCSAKAAQGRRWLDRVSCAVPELTTDYDETLHGIPVTPIAILTL